MSRLRDRWQQYEQVSVSATVTALQRVQLQHAYYTGATAVLDDLQFDCEWWLEGDRQA